LYEPIIDVTGTVTIVGVALVVVFALVVLVATVVVDELVPVEVVVVVDTGATVGQLTAVTFEQHFPPINAIGELNREIAEERASYTAFGSVAFSSDDDHA